MTEKNQFWNHYLREQHKLFFHFTTISHRVIKSRTDDSIHSRSSASEVESRWYHWRCELVTAVFLDHLGFCNKTTRNSILNHTFPSEPFSEASLTTSLVQDHQQNECSFEEQPLSPFSCIISCRCRDNISSANPI